MAWFDKKKEEVVEEKPVIVETIKTNMPAEGETVVVKALPETDSVPAPLEAVAPMAPVTPTVVIPTVDALGLVYFVWVMYKLNLITRIQVKDFLEVIKKGDWPKDVVKYLTDEVKKL